MKDEEVGAYIRASLRALRDGRNRYAPNDATRKINNREHDEVTERISSLFKFEMEQNSND